MMKTIYMVVGLLLSSTSVGLAYDAEPEQFVDQDKKPSVLVAQACTQQLTPRMAAAFGLPIVPTGCKQG